MVRAAREWRNERRDERLFRSFLTSPALQHEILTKSARTPCAALLMITLQEFIRSERQRDTFRCIHRLTSESLPNDDNLPSADAKRWERLIHFACNCTDTRCDGGFIFMADHGPVPIYVRWTFPDFGGFANDWGKWDEDPVAFMRNLDDAMHKLSESSETFMILSKSPLNGL
jgi:hypothetical protein